MTFEKGSLILVEYTMHLKGDDEVVETTDADEAEKHHIHDPDAMYGPKLVSIGVPNYPVLRGFEEELAEMSVGERKTIEVKPEKAWGARDTKKVRMYPLRKLGRDAERYSVGDFVEIGDREGIIRFIGSGRAQVDFNHEYAGKTLVYDVTVVKHLKEHQDIIAHILESRLGLDATVFLLDPDSVLIPLREYNIDVESIHVMKRNAVRDILRFIPGMLSVKFIDMYKNKAMRDAEVEAAQDQNAESVDEDEDVVYRMEDVVYETKGARVEGVAARIEGVAARIEGVAAGIEDVDEAGLEEDEDVTGLESAGDESVDEAGLEEDEDVTGLESAGDEDGGRKSVAARVEEVAARVEEVAAGLESAGGKGTEGLYLYARRGRLLSEVRSEDDDSAAAETDHNTARDILSEFIMSRPKPDTPSVEDEEDEDLDEDGLDAPATTAGR